MLIPFVTTGVATCRKTDPRFQRCGTELADQFQTLAHQRSSRPLSVFSGRQNVGSHYQVVSAD